MNQTSRGVDFEELRRLSRRSSFGTGGDGGTFYPLHRGPWRTRTAWVPVRERRSWSVALSDISRAL